MTRNDLHELEALPREQDECPPERLPLRAWLMAALIIIVFLYAARVAAAANPIPPSGIHTIAGNHQQNAPTNVAGTLILTGKAANIENTRREQAALFRVADGDTLRLDNLTSSQITWAEDGDWKPNRAVELWRGSRFIASDWKIADGYGLHVWSCDAATITRGGIAQPTHQYNAFLGSLENGLERGNFADFIADQVAIDGFGFINGRKETALRVMGAQRTYITNSTFTRAWKDRPNGWHLKHVAQLRHMRGGLFNNRVDGSIEAGELAPSINNGRHFRVAARFPTYIEFAGNTRRGSLKACGNTFIIVDGDQVVGRDPSNQYGRAAFELATYNHKGSTHRPTIMVVNTSVSGPGWERFAAAGVQIGPGCTFNGRPVPQTPGFDWNEFKRIRAERKATWKP